MAKLDPDVADLRGEHSIHIHWYALDTAFLITGTQYDRCVTSSVTRSTVTRSEEDARVGLIAISLLIVMKSER